MVLMDTIERGKAGAGNEKGGSACRRKSPKYPFELITYYLLHFHVF